MSIVLVAPTHNKLVSFADNFVNNLSEQLEESTGLKLTYASLSPSILSVFSIDEINLYNSQDQKILSINKTKINYNLRRLIKKDLQNGIKNITIDGISLELDKVLEIIEMFTKSESQNKFDYAEIKTKIPSLIKLKNISIKYNNDMVYSELLLKEISLNNNAKRENLSFNLNSKIYADLFKINEKLSGSLAITGTIPDTLDNSRVYFRFDDLTDGNYKLSKLNLMLTYVDNKIELQTIQAVNPIYIWADYNLSEGLANAEIRTEKLNPLTVVSSNQKKLNSLRNLLVDTNTKIFCDVNKKLVDYSSNGAVFVPDSLFPKGLNIKYSLSGDEKAVNLQYLNLDGQNCQASMNLSFIYNTFQLAGFAELPYFTLPNGNTVSTELYFDPLDKGFMAFSPQVFIGSKALTAIQFSFLPQPDSYDFVFEAYDYSHAMQGEPGLVKFDGSYLLNNNYLQGGISLSSLFLDSMIEFAEQVMEPEIVQKVDSVKSGLADFMFSGDVYTSTDFKEISFSVPYLLLANTKKDNQFLMLAANGNEQSVQLNQLSVILGKYAVQAGASLDINPDSKDMFFTADINADSVPYHFSGTIMPEIITITGDYGADIEIRFGANKAINGHAYLKDLPLSYEGNSIILSTEADFNYDTENGPAVAVKHLEVEEASAKFSVSPKLMLSGNVTKYGAQIDSIAYTDFYSALEGTADVMVNINDNVFDSVGLIMNVKNPLSEEAILMDATVSNPEHIKLDAQSLKEALYINSQIQISNFGLNRFTTQKHDNNLLSASLFASGTINHPYVALSVEDFSILMAGNFLKTWGSITLEDKLLSVNNLGVNFQMINTDDIKASFSLDTFEGKATGSINTDVNGKNVHVPLEITVSDTVMKPGKMLPESTIITLSSNKIDGTLMKKDVSFDISALYSSGGIALFSSDNIGLFGNIYNDGSMNISMNSGEKVKMTVTGVATKNETNIKIGNVYADLHHLLTYVDFDDSMIVDKGILKGSVSILNSFNDPILKGAMLVEEPVALLPSMFAHRLSAPKILITVINNEIRVHDTDLLEKGSNYVNVGATVYMNKWNVDHIDATVKTKNQEAVALRMTNSAFILAGDVICNLKWYIEGNSIDVKGSVFGEGVTLTSALTSITGGGESQQNPIRADLDIVLGNHATLNFDPLLRCVFVPNTHIKLKMDTEENLYEVDGKLAIKSGDIAYLNRNFYIKEGSIKFNKDDLTNPQVTITAETRERDDNGQNVRIILSAENQYLQSFTPKFSSVPAKSENEIRVLLGQIVVADANNGTNFLLSAGDYAIQSAIMRKAENKLREVLNFDIFSMRTNVLQNALSINNLSNDNENLRIGNFLDNSTVYMGKYLGSSIYLDAMLHFSFGDSYARDISSVGRLLLQPEFGLEMESPSTNLKLNMFPNANPLVSGNIRWNMAPDINALLNHQFVPSSTVTFSLKVAF